VLGGFRTWRAALGGDGAAELRAAHAELAGQLEECGAARQAIQHYLDVARRCVSPLRAWCEFSWGVLTPRRVRGAGRSL
jgi:hypothetical protein